MLERRPDDYEVLHSKVSNRVERFTRILFGVTVMLLTIEIIAQVIMWRMR